MGRKGKTNYAAKVWDQVRISGPWRHKSDISRLHFQGFNYIHEHPINLFGLCHISDKIGQTQLSKVLGECIHTLQMRYTVWSFGDTSVWESCMWVSKNLFHTVIYLCYKEISHWVQICDSTPLSVHPHNSFPIKNGCGKMKAFPFVDLFLTSVKTFFDVLYVNLCNTGFWSQQELGGLERLWLCNYRPPEVNYSYLCLVPPIWTTQALCPLPCSPSRLRSSAPGPAPKHPNSAECHSYPAYYCSSKLSSTFSCFSHPFLPLFLFLNFSVSYLLFFHSTPTLPLYSVSVSNNLKETAPRNVPTLRRKLFWMWKTRERFVILWRSRQGNIYFFVFVDRKQNKKNILCHP